GDEASADLFRVRLGQVGQRLAVQFQVLKRLLRLLGRALFGHGSSPPGLLYRPTLTELSQAGRRFVRVADASSFPNAPGRTHSPKDGREGGWGGPGGEPSTSRWRPTATAKKITPRPNTADPTAWCAIRKTAPARRNATAAPIGFPFSCFILA